MLQPSTLSFLKSLKKNNNKDWFNRNREKYDAARSDFENLVTSVLHRLILADPDLRDLEVKNCMFRINRDVRFSKDKTPYKVNMSAFFNKGGKKSVNAGYYLHLQPDGNSFAGGGLWSPAATELKKVRQEIDYCYPEFKEILAAPEFKKNYGDLEREHVLVNVPKGYPKDNPAAEFLKLKSFVGTKNIPDAALLLPGLGNEIAGSFNALKPLVKFINRAFD